MKLSFFQGTFCQLCFYFWDKKEKSISKYPILNVNNVFLRFPNKILCPSYTYCCLTLCPYCILTLTKLPFFSIKSSCWFTGLSLRCPAKLWILKSTMVQEIWKCLLLVRLLEERHEEIVWPGVKWIDCQKSLPGGTGGRRQLWMVHCHSCYIYETWRSKEERGREKGFKVINLTLRGLQHSSKA